MFEIRFLDRELEEDERGTFRRGEIIFGAWREEFLAPVGDWSESDYERAWLGAAERLINGSDRVAFVHHMAHPAASHHFIWQAWCEAERVYFQERILLADELLEPFLLAEPDAVVEARERFTEDGERVSEWQVDLAAIRAFVERRRRSIVPA